MVYVLPKPDKIYGHYKLPDGSIIYPSGTPCKPVYLGRWFLYIIDTVIDKSTKKHEGHVVMTPTGVRYFDSPQEALEAYERYNK